MRTKFLVPAFAVACLAILPACSINVQKGKDGEDAKKVDIDTPLGGIHVNQDVDASEVGIPVYPGARLMPKDDSGGDKSANVNISGFGYGLKVVALEYQSDDAPEKLVAFYKDKLKNYGSVLECHTSGFNMNADVKTKDDGRHELACEGPTGSNVELKVGTKENQHIVGIEAQGKGSKFSLVYVRTHGKSADI